jgi:hypothetical protein
VPFVRVEQPPVRLGPPITLRTRLEEHGGFVGPQGAPGGGSLEDSGGRGMVSGVGVSRHERPHAHHELALRSAGRGTGCSRARAAPLAAGANSASMHPAAHAVVGGGPAHWPSQRIHGGHRLASPHQHGLILLRPVDSASGALHLQPVGVQRTGIRTARGHSGCPLPTEHHHSAALAAVTSRGAGFFGWGDSAAQWGGWVFEGSGGPHGVWLLPWGPLGWTAPLTSSVDGPSLLLRHLVRTARISDSKPGP